MDDFYGDSAYTFEIGEVSKEVRNLLKVTKESLILAIDRNPSTGFPVFAIPSTIFFILKHLHESKYRN